ncbi:type VII secretion target [Cellulomonas palmilytica]|uniref:type VII secretion target n=1 Tax=Cellulomonas palmilytica TaxID=2608402 RepID=UPI001EEF30F1|nr:type VII secretion target [Cellulomonas palmilytica]
MSADPDVRLDVVLGALRREATTWDEQAAAVRLVADAAGRLSLSTLESGVFALMHGAHADAVEHVVGRCREGGEAMADVATALRTTADAYERRDAAVAELVAGTF